MPDMQCYWHHPPWLQKPEHSSPVAKHRLGAKPLDIADWFVSDADQLAHKTHCLQHQYIECVGQSLSKVPGLAEWQLPIAQSSFSYSHDVATRFADVAEDVCILDCRDQFRLVAACVCAPSYWSIDEKIGLPLFDVHAPVDGMNGKLGDRIDHFLHNMPVAQPFYRNNWFVHNDAQYHHKDDETYELLDDDPETWMFRTEHQVLYKPVPEYLIFTIRIEFAPFVALRHHALACLGFRQALMDMDADEIAHFGGLAKHQRLLETVHSLHRR